VNRKRLYNIATTAILFIMIFGCGGGGGLPLASRENEISGDSGLFPSGSYVAESPKCGSTSSSPSYDGLASYDIENAIAYWKDFDGVTRKFRVDLDDNTWIRIYESSTCKLTINGKIAHYDEGGIYAETNEQIHKWEPEGCGFVKLSLSRNNFDSRFYLDSSDKTIGARLYVTAMDFLTYRVETDYYDFSSVGCGSYDYFYQILTEERE